ncbi:unnamed protein product [Fusarium equiseti]|uniref:Uncharacterized protein n=1 Tax=Fusarium equiseti TaxID=61235 RepID=A0A8J2IPX8_FUSEQ|nr:unnamed protein product [Fusarium equiseti]
MSLLVKAAFAAFALGVSADPMIDNIVPAPYGGVPSPPIGYMMDNMRAGSALGYPSPAKSITLADIIPQVDSKGHSRCCPVGTINDGTGCVFQESSVCEKGTVLQGNVCVSVHGPQCPDGLEFDGRTCRSDEPPKCAGSSLYSRATNQCESSIPPQCPATYHLDRGTCVSEIPPGCPIGYSERNGVCVDNTLPSCDGPDLVFDKGDCVSKFPPKCPEGTEVRGKTCYGTVPPQCDDGGRLERGHCVLTPECPPQSRLNGWVCVREGEPECATGTFKDGICHADPTCPEDWTYDASADTCKFVTDPQCTSGITLFTAKNGIKGCCKEGSDDFDGEFCSWEVTQSGECPEDTEYKDGYCVHAVENPTCPDLYENVNGMCIKRTLPQCHEGSYNKGKCILGDPTCPAGSQFNGKECVLIKRPSCAAGSSLVDSKCVARKLPTCPCGQRQEGDECIHEELPSCPDGTRLDNGVCKLRGKPEMVEFSACSSPVRSLHLDAHRQEAEHFRMDLWSRKARVPRSGRCCSREWTGADVFQLLKLLSRERQSSVAWRFLESHQYDILGTRRSIVWFATPSAADSETTCFMDVSFKGGSQHSFRSADS